MSITRLQQARQMYAMGQRVAKTLDGSRPGYRGSDYGDEARGTGGYSGSGDTGDFGTEKANVANTKAANDYSFTGPSELGVTTRTVNRVTAPNAKEYIGGKAFDVTPATKAIRERAKVKQAILNPTVKRNKIFDPISNSFINPFATTQDPFSLGNIAKNIFLGAVAPQLLAGTKLGPAINTFNQVNRVAGLFNKNIDVKNTISNMFSGNKTTTSKSKSTSKNNTTNNGGKGDGEGLASLENQAGGYDEYILLLQKLQSGNITDEERNRYNVLKNMLGI